MIRAVRRLARDERGQTLALMAVMIAGVVSILALAVDLGMLFVAHTEAQNAAEAAALGGAREFMIITPATAAVVPAHDSAMSYAVRNWIRKVPIDTSEVTIVVDPNRRRVWVRIERTTLGLWFARLFGRSVATVNAAAAAEAARAGGAVCPLPFAVPDIWYDADNDTNGDRIWDLTESWDFGSSASDYYLPFGYGVVSPPETGYGSAFRDGAPGGITADKGRPMTLKVQQPGSTLSTGFFYPVRLPGNTGANDYSTDIQQCDPTAPSVPLNTPLDLEMGNMVGPTAQGIRDLIATDPTATWDATTNTVVSPYGMSSPRIRNVPLYDPRLIAAIQASAKTCNSCQHQVSFNNFAEIFVEGMWTDPVTKDDFVIGRFLYYAGGTSGGAPGGVTGPLVLTLRLVE